MRLRAEMERMREMERMAKKEISKKGNPMKRVKATRSMMTKMKTTRRCTQLSIS